MVHVAGFPWRAKIEPFVLTITFQQQETDVTKHRNHTRLGDSNNWSAALCPGGSHEWGFPARVEPETQSHIIAEVSGKATQKDRDNREFWGNCIAGTWFVVAG